MVHEQKIFQRAKELDVSAGVLAELTAISIITVQKVSAGRRDFTNDEVKACWAALSLVEQMREAFSPFRLDLRHPKFTAEMASQFRRGFQINVGELNSSSDNASAQ